MIPALNGGPRSALVPASAEPTSPVPAPASEAVALLAMIERAARDPSVDVDKFQRLMELRLANEARMAEQAFGAAMTAAQGEMRAIATDSDNPHTRSRYASAYALDRAIRPIYTKHGFSLSFDTGEGAPENCVRVLCHVTACGHSRRYHIDMPADGKGAKAGDVMSKTHATGAAVTYGMRYLLKMIFNLAIGGEDDDGNGAAPTGELVSREQIVKLETLVKETGANVEKFCTYIKVASIDAIPAAQFKSAVAALNLKKRRRA